MPKLVLNKCYGGFSLSVKANCLYAKLANVKRGRFYDRDLSRHDPILVQVVEQLGSEKASGSCARLTVSDELPSGTRYRIDEYDGYESLILEQDQHWSVIP